MNEELARFKEALINSGAFKRTATRRDEYRGKICPRCGDVKWHTYLKIDVTNESPVVWHCFKCNEAGIVNKEFLKAYDLSINTPRNVKYHKQIDVQEAVSTNLNIFNHVLGLYQQWKNYKCFVTLVIHSNM